MRLSLARPVDIIGVSITKLGLVTETAGIKNMTSRELWAWAAYEAMEDAGITPKEIDALFVGNMVSELSEDRYHLGNILIQWTGMDTGNGAWKPAVRLDGACASSSHAIRQGVFAIAAKDPKFVQFVRDNNMVQTYMNAKQYTQYLKKNYEVRAPLIHELGLAYK
jgi:acetyl-CoA C-acetyltransferase